MNKYKICPECHEKNEPFMIECAFCEADLTGVKITDEETEKMTRANATAPAEPSASGTFTHAASILRNSAVSRSLGARISLRGYPVPRYSLCP